jgi:hypothetical protein
MRIGQSDSFDLAAIGQRAEDTPPGRCCRRGGRAAEDDGCDAGPEQLLT